MPSAHPTQNDVRLAPLTVAMIDAISANPHAFLESLPDSAGLADTLRAAVESQRSLYERKGAAPPWIGYLARRRSDDAVVGVCSFVGPPKHRSVEIAYFAFPPYEGRRVAGAMAAALVGIAAGRAEIDGVHAFTLPHDNPSTRILQAAGFARTGEAVDDDAGPVWRWDLDLKSRRREGT